MFSKETLELGKMYHECCYPFLVRVFGCYTTHGDTFQKSQKHVKEQSTVRAPNIGGFGYLYIRGKIDLEMSRN